MPARAQHGANSFQFLQMHVSHGSFQGENNTPPLMFNTSRVQFFLPEWVLSSKAKFLECLRRGERWGHFWTLWAHTHTWDFVQYPTHSGICCLSGAKSCKVAEKEMHISHVGDPECYSNQSGTMWNTHKYLTCCEIHIKLPHSLSSITCCCPSGMTWERT